MKHHDEGKPVVYINCGCSRIFKSHRHWPGLASIIEYSARGLNEDGKVYSAWKGFTPEPEAAIV